jgi:hypothetical protein
LLFDLTHGLSSECVVGVVSLPPDVSKIPGLAGVRSSAGYQTANPLISGAYESDQSALWSLFVGLLLNNRGRICIV